MTHVCTSGTIKKSILIVTLYVDDLLMTESDKAEIPSLKGELSKRFEMKDLVAVNFMPGIEIKHDRANRRLFISQAAYAEEV